MPWTRLAFSCECDPWEGPADADPPESCPECGAKPSTQLTY